MAEPDPRLPSAAAGPSAGTDADLDLDLPCPGCGAELTADPGFERLRVCSACRRHFPLTARERLTLLVDPDSLVETNAALVSVDPLVFHDRLPYPDRLAEARERAELPEAVITGVGAVGGQPAVLVALDCAYLGGGIGVVAGEKITLAMELAETRRLPLVALCAGGGARTQEGMLSLVQLAKTAAAATRLHRAGVPFVAVLTHPTTGGVYAGLANQADVLLAEPGAQIGFRAAGRAAAEPGAGTNTAEFLLAHGMLDAVIDRSHLRDTVATLLALAARRGLPRGVDGPSPAASPPASPPAWEVVGLARHPERPTALDYVHRLFADFVELHGDRVSGDDPAVVCGLGRLDGVSVAIVAQERGRGPDAGRRHGGRVGPAGYRKAIRVLRLAGHLELPVVTLIDTPGAATGAEAEAGGIGVALSQAFGLSSILPVPIVSAVIGEGGGVGALALGVADRILMLERAVYSVPGPEGAGGHLYRVADRAAEAAPSLKLTARECQRLGVVDVIVPEPEPAAHADPDAAARHLRAALLHALADLSGIGPRRLVDDRARRVRHMGQTTPEGREAARHEVRELQELQRTLARSLNDLRDRWEGRARGRPRLNLHLHRPDLADLAARLAARRPGLAGSVVLHDGGDEGDGAEGAANEPPAPEATGER